MDEFALIRRYFQQAFDRSLDVTGGADDCAALILPPNHVQHLSIDTMVENVHFYADMPSYDIGHRALATALSDLAAMGAKPWWCSLALTLPNFDEAWLAGFSQGFASLAQHYQLQLIGGDTTKGPLTISVQVAGLSAPDAYLTRSGAKVGDLVCVTGSLGDAAGGLKQWYDARPNRYLRQRYAAPRPRCEFAIELAPLASAAIDISDGLVADAGHIAKASACALAIEVPQLPISPQLAASFDAASCRRMALSGGDDYELCFCLDPARLGAVQALALAYDLAVTVVGLVQAGEGVHLLENGQAVSIAQTGYHHF